MEKKNKFLKKTHSISRLNINMTDHELCVIRCWRVEGWIKIGLEKLRLKRKQQSSAAATVLIHPSVTATVAACIKKKSVCSQSPNDIQKNKHAKGKNVLDHRAQLQHEKGLLALHFSAYVSLSVF